MENLEKVHPVLEGIVMDAALKALDTLPANVCIFLELSKNYNEFLFNQF